MREFALLEHIYAANSSLTGAQIVVPPGDDMAVLRAPGGGDILIAVDQLVAGRHVDMAATPLALVGRKAICRCISDIAAMAARPLATVVAAVLPPDFGEDRASELFDAMRIVAAEQSCPLVGGDIALHDNSAHPLTLSVTVLATPGPTPPITRSGARPGDMVYVTGSLGGSLQQNGLGRHLTFEPRVAEALELAAALGDRLHAMIDLSDGLGRDADHIAVRSDVRIVLDAATIPCAPGCDWRAAAGDGEDYELCFTASGEVGAGIGALPVTCVGRVDAVPAGEAPGAMIRHGDDVLAAGRFGWEHT